MNTIKLSVIGILSLGLAFTSCSKDDDDGGSSSSSCNAPQNSIVDATSATSLSLSWEANGGSAWNVEYGESGFTQGNGMTTTTSTNAVTLTDLVGNTAYDVYIQNDCGDATSSWVGPVTISTNNPIVGTWRTYDPSDLLAGLGVDEIVAEFNSNNTYVVTSYSSGAQTVYEGTYTTSSSANASGIYSITLSQSSPSTLTSEGIYQVYVASPDSMWYEVAQTDPAITGVTAPTAGDGFGSTSGGAYGTMNVQKYLREE
tara:strand:+ start:9625 stop:10395 length:771 start_codon:yes stop_codon:yes gene_type:complete